MAKTLVKRLICGACGAEAREGSAFCHKCGSEVVAHEPLPPAIMKPTSGISNGGNDPAAGTQVESEPELPPVTAPVEPLEHVSVSPAFAESTDAAPKTRLERVRPNKRVQKVVEVEWVERHGLSVGFILTAVVLAALAGLMVAAALYLR